MKKTTKIIFGTLLISIPTWGAITTYDSANIFALFWGIVGWFAFTTKVEELEDYKALSEKRRISQKRGNEQ